MKEKGYRFNAYACDVTDFVSEACVERVAPRSARSISW